MHAMHSCHLGEIFQVLELESRNVKALYRRAQAYIQLVDLDLAEHDIKKALEIDPDNRYICCSNLLFFKYVIQLRLL